MEAQAQDLLEKLVAIDTGTAPVRERPAAQVLVDGLKRDGISAQILDDGSGRAGVYARIQGGREQPPLLLLSHLDTHPFEAELWPKETGPLSGDDGQGSIWGRGVLDGKGLAVLHAVALGLVAKSGGLNRDVLLVVTAEGALGQGTGLARMIEAHPEIATASMVLTKGGAGYVDLLGDGRLVHGLAYAERGWARLEVAAVAGEAGVPSPKNRVVQAVSQALLPRPRSTLTPPIEALWRYSTQDQAWPLQLAAGSQLLTKWFLIEGWSQRPETRGLVQDDLRLERLDVGVDRARGILAARTLPGSSVAGMLAEVRIRTANESVHVQILEGAEANESPLSPALLAFFREAIDPKEGEVVAPILATEPTDGHRLRAIGVPTYGYLPLPLDRDALASIHGRNERVRVADLGLGAERMARLIHALTHSVVPAHSTR
jgi:acetylornithine deacetylase/succinyl-diaminopimelate desuccinylase-like protein